MSTALKLDPAKASASNAVCTKSQSPLLDESCKSKQVRRVPIEETKVRFGQNWFQLIAFSRSFEISGDIFGVTFDARCDRTYSSKGLAVFLGLLRNAAERLRSITKVPDPNLYPIRFVKESGFSTGTGYAVDIGRKYLDEFSKVDECQRCFRLKTSIESQYFHELLHRVRLYRQDEDGREVVPMMGEFLYDPIRNHNRNTVFRQLGLNLGRFIQSNPNPVNNHDQYLRDWVVISRILIFEYQKLNADFAVPSPLSGQIGILECLPVLFQSVDTHARDEILKRFVHLSAEEIETISDDCRLRLDLSY